MFQIANRLKICQTILQQKFGAWGCLQIEEKMYLVSNCHVKKIAVKFVLFFFNKYFLIFLFSCNCFILYKKTENL